MRVYKDKQYLIFDYEDGRVVKYDFATKTAIGIKGKPVKNLQKQLAGFTLDRLFECCDDKQYAKFLKFIKRAERSQISNIGTILNRVPKYARFEQIFSAGIEDIIDARSLFKYSINEIPKSLLKLCNKYPIKLSNKIVKFYKENPDAHYIAYNINYLSLNYNDIYEIWEKSHWDGQEKSLFNELVCDFGYNAKDLWLYFDRIKTFEAIDDVKYLIKELLDYADMMRTLSNKYDKYPRNLLTTHRIACRNYERMYRDFSEELFKKRINKKYECSFGDYIFIYPKSTQEIKQEACMQNNCVVSYIDKVIDGKCHILF